MKGVRQFFVLRFDGICIVNISGRAKFFGYF